MTSKLRWEEAGRGACPPPANGLSLKWLGAIRTTLISVDRYSADGRQTLGGGSERCLAGGSLSPRNTVRLLAGRWKEYPHGRP
jgi:hypothetical protein